MPKLVAAIIPAYNEETTVADVVSPLTKSPYVSEVIVISDGSSDRTAEVARNAGAVVHELPSTGGKGEAMLQALKHTKAPIVVFFDADLVGLTQEHIEQLILPVISGSRMMNVGLRDRGPLVTFITKHLPLIGGERAMLRQVILGVPSRYLSGFMVETSLNYYCRSRGYSYGAVILRDLSIVRKYEKVGIWLGMIQYVRMFFQVVKAMIVVRLARLRREF